MRCTDPRTVGFYADGKTLCWSKKKFSKEYATFQLPCGKCIDCRLEYARQWATRCIHEAQMHEKNCFITLTYSDQNLQSPKLVYEDFQKFMKKLRKLQNEPIGMFVTGEYGEKTKRPHWHAIIFNWAPSDGTKKYKNIQGDQVYESATLNKAWGLGISEFGSVTLRSAGYCARYAAKKLVHGKDQDHEYHPISKKSSKHAIGKKWIEKYWPDVFNYGRLQLPDGTTTSIPRYYEKWFRENKPQEWEKYITKTKSDISLLAAQRSQQEHLLWTADQHRRLDEGKLTFSPTENQRRRLITIHNHKLLQSYLKL